MMIIMGYFFTISQPGDSNEHHKLNFKGEQTSYVFVIINIHIFVWSTNILGIYGKYAAFACKIKLSKNNLYSTKKLRKSQKTIQHKNTKSNNYSVFIYLFRYMSSAEKKVYFSLLAPMPLLWHSVK